MSHYCCASLACVQARVNSSDFTYVGESKRSWNSRGPEHGRRGAESARADFNHRELPCYLSNSYETLPLSLQFIGDQDSGKVCCQGYKLLPWKPDF